MKKEPDSNIGHVHPGCAEDRRQKWQKANVKTSIKIGSSVKIRFSQGEDGEHMWVEVIEILIGEIFLGKLDNYPGIPSIAKKWKYGDIIEFTRSEIEDHIS